MQSCLRKKYLFSLSMMISESSIHSCCIYENQSLMSIRVSGEMRPSLLSVNCVQMSSSSISISPVRMDSVYFVNCDQNQVFQSSCSPLEMIRQILVHRLNLKQMIISVNHLVQKKSSCVSKQFCVVGLLNQAKKD